ncbi:hypothetical protein D1N53_22810 [Clostridioides difficile]|nr:hypothetical protein D1N53_22810 [Clostridioides difficile]
MDFRKFAYNNIVRNFRAYLAYFLSSVFSIMIFFVFSVVCYSFQLSSILQNLSIYILRNFLKSTI